MLYRPSKEKQWDSWILKHNYLYYMFYINVSVNGTRWDGISLATSSDLLHWFEHGRVIDKHVDAIWLGTGMVHKVQDYFIMNYSLEMPVGYQRIYFASSKDLYTWEKLEGVVCSPDPRIYMSEPEETCDAFPRWDSLGIFDATKGTEPPYYAFCSSNIKGATLVEKAGVLGLLTSEDGLNWQCLEPAFRDPEQFPSFEVPEYVMINNRHYALFCTSSYLGYRNDPLAEYASGGTFYVVADDKLGPYRLPPTDPMLQGTRDNYMVGMNYVGRVLHANNELLYYHIWGDPIADAWMGLVKRLSERSPFVLQLTYYEHNEELKGKLLLKGVSIEFLRVEKNVGVIPAVEWHENSGDLFFKNNGSSACLNHDYLSGAETTETYTDLRDGRIFECNLEIEGMGAGIYFHTYDDKKACIFLNHRKQRVEFGFIENGWGANMVLHKDMYKNSRIGAKNKIKLFVRRFFVELYLDDMYVAGWRLLRGINPNRLGFYAEDSTGCFKSIKLWEMK